MTTTDKTLGILGLFTIDCPEWTVDAAAQHLGIPVSTAYRYFKSLTSAGLIVAFNPGRYVLGPAIIQYDHQIRTVDPLLATARGPMQAMARSLPKHSLVLLCGLHRNQVMCVHEEFVERSDFSLAYERGRLMPIHAGPPGLIILALMSLRDAQAYHERHGDELAQAGLGPTWEEVRKALRATRQARVVSGTADATLGVAWTSVGMIGQDGSVAGSLSTAIPSQSHDKLRFEDLSRQLLAASELIYAGLALRGAEDYMPPPAASLIA